MPDRLEAALNALAGAQCRNVTRAQLLGLGFGQGAIEHRLRTGRLSATEHAGVYALGGPPRTPHERAYAAVLAVGAGHGWLAGHAALALWEFRRRWPGTLEVITTRNRRPRGLIVHRARVLHPADRTRQHGVPVTSPARAVLDTAVSLGEQLPRTIHDALLSPWLGEAELLAVCARHPLHPGTKLVLALLGTDDGASRSEWERWFPVWCIEHGLPMPVMNVRVLGRERDAYFPCERVIVELDSWAFHRDRHSFEDDRERDADALDHDVLTVRVTWDRQHGAPRREAERLRRILDRRRALFERAA